MQKSNILWTEYTWNPNTGCPPPLASEGCANCYARELHNKRHEAYKQGKKLPAQYAKPFEQMQFFPDRLDDPLHCKDKDAKIFIDSMSDLFHSDVPFEYIDKVMAVIALCPQHTFQILTKRIDRVLEYVEQEPQGNIDHAILDGIAHFVGKGKPYSGKGLTKHLRGEDGLWPLPNLWLGTSISTQADANKNIPILLQILAAVRFLSIEPMLEEIYLPGPLLDHGFGYEYNQKPERIHQVIVGCESGPKRRLCKLEWIRNVVRHCEGEIPVFVKQVPINGKCSKNPDEWPEDLRIRKFPC